MKNQTGTVGIFIILIGILILVYWALLPVPEKERLLGEMYENISNKTVSNVSYNVPSTSKLILKDIYLYSDKKEIIVADNYYLGSLIPINEISFGSIEEETSIFAGKRSRNFNFYYSNGDGVLLSFVSKCSGGYIEIKVNGYVMYKGCPSGLHRVMVQRDYLKEGNNVLTIDFYPNSIFSKSTFSLDNLKVFYLKRSEINYDLYYQGEKVYISYDFCPTDPNAIGFYINDNRISLYSCQNNYFDITPFLKNGINRLRIISNVETKINLKLITQNNIFMYIFNFTVREPVKLMVIKDQGYAELYINSCKFYLSSYHTSFTFSLNRNCINDGENVLLIKPGGLVRIYMLSLS